MRGGKEGGYRGSVWKSGQTERVRGEKSSQGVGCLAELGEERVREGERERKVSRRQGEAGHCVLGLVMVCRG